MIVLWLFLAVPWVCLQFVIVVFPDHNHLLFLSRLVRPQGITLEYSLKLKIKRNVWLLADVLNFEFETAVTLTSFVLASAFHQNYNLSTFHKGLEKISTLFRRIGSQLSPSYVNA